MEELPKINGIEVTHVFKRTNQDCIVIDSNSDMRTIMFVDGSTTTLHRTNLLPIRIK